MKYLTVGPTQLYKTVEKHIATALRNDVAEISHRGCSYKMIHEETVTHLRRLLSIPKTHHIFFTGSSLESMERIIQNVVDKQSFHFINGEFSKKFFQFAKNLGKKPLSFEVTPGEGYDLAKVKIPKATELICITQNETSTGVAIPVEDINRLAANYPHMLIALDVVSALPYVDLDYKLIDLAFFSGQKGFGIPAGMGVLIVSNRAVEKAKMLQKKGKTIGSYHNFVTLSEKAKEFQTPETPNVLAMYLLGKVTEDFLQIGIKTLREQTEQKASILYAHFYKHNEYAPFVKDPVFRSQTTVVIDLHNKTKEVLATLKASGIVVSSGYGQYKDTHIRIANFPSQEIADIRKLTKLL